jgi:hypothetical protein
VSADSPRCLVDDDVSGRHQSGAVGASLRVHEAPVAHSLHKDDARLPGSELMQVLADVERSACQRQCAIAALDLSRLEFCEIKVVDRWWVGECRGRSDERRECHSDDESHSSHNHSSPQCLERGGRQHDHRHSRCWLSRPRERDYPRWLRGRHRQSRKLLADSVVGPTNDAPPFAQTAFISVARGARRARGVPDRRSRSCKGRTALRRLSPSRRGEPVAGPEQSPSPAKRQVPRSRLSTKARVLCQR